MAAAAEASEKAKWQLLFTKGAEAAAQTNGKRPTVKRGKILWRVMTDHASQERIRPSRKRIHATTTGVVLCGRLLLSFSRYIHIIYIYTKTLEGDFFFILSLTHCLFTHKKCSITINITAINKFITNWSILIVRTKAQKLYKWNIFLNH